MNKTDNMVEYKKEYYLKNKEHLLGIMLKEVQCECGFTCGKSNLIRHQTSKLHLKKLNKKKENL